MHEGHRNRVAGKLLDGSTFYEHETVELLLYNACPRKDLNAVAHRLIDKFGSIGGMLSASVEELMTVEGIGRNMAEYIRVLGLCTDRAGGSFNFGIIKNTESFLRLFNARPHREGEVELYVLDRDDRVRRIASFPVDNKFEGRVIAYLAASRAFGVFAAHNGVNFLPDEEDGKILNGLTHLCRTCGVRLYDYCVSGADGVFSYFIHGEMSGDRS